MNLQVKELNKVNLQTKLNALKAFLSSYSKGSRSLYHCGVPLQVKNLFLKIDDNFQLLGTHSFEFIPGIAFGF